MSDFTGTGRPRLAVVDMARGAAIIGVVFYHFAWDLRYFEFIQIAVDRDSGWFVFARSLLFSFMFLTGVSLQLAHGGGIRWRPFWRRFGVLVAASVAISLGTWVFFPQAFVYFGVLHAIALCSVLALPFIRAPLWMVLAVAIVVVVAPFLYSSQVFTARPLSWIGFWETPPFTNDLVPVFPWFGVVLLGVAGARLVAGRGLEGRLARVEGRSFFGRALKKAGRWSLVIYLIHQPIWLAILFPLAQMTDPGAGVRRVDFVQSCQQSCEIGEGEQGFCERYCACSLEQVESQDLWASLAADPPTDAQQRAISQVTRLCSAMAAE